MPELREHQQEIVHAREKDPHPALLLLVAALLAAAAALLLAFATRWDKTAAIVGKPAVFSPPPPESRPPAETGVLTSLSSLYESADKSQLQGRPAAIRDAQVQAVPGDYLFWMGPDAQSAIPVALLGELAGRQPESQTHVEIGQRVTVFGVVHLVGGSGLVALDPYLGPAEQNRLRDIGIYIEASRVIVTDPPSSAPTDAP